MNPAALLSLIGSLWEQLVEAQQEAASLRGELAQLREQADESGAVDE